MAALLDKPEAVAVQPCIRNIAAYYPQALVYAVLISSESYQFEDSTTGQEQEDFVNRYMSSSVFTVAWSFMSSNQNLVLGRKEVSQLKLKSLFFFYLS